MNRNLRDAGRMCKGRVQGALKTVKEQAPGMIADQIANAAIYPDSAVGRAVKVVEAVTDPASAVRPALKIIRLVASRIVG